MEITNRFKGPDLIDRVPGELWTEVRDSVQEAGSKTIPKEKKCKNAKWLSEEALQIAEKRREAKGKGEKERHPFEWRFLKKLNIELPYDPEIPLLGLYPEESIIQKNICTPMFMAALFTIARIWK